MNSQTLPHGIVRLSALALMVGVAACSDETLTAPEAMDDVMVVTASAKNGKGVGATNVVYEPQRYRQVRAYAPGTLTEFGQTNESVLYRVCQLNSYEDLDGNDFSHFDRKDGYRKETINEQDGFVMIQELHDGDWQVTHIGRSNWSGQFWFDDGDGGNQMFVNSHGRGVVFPVLNANGEARDSDVGTLLEWLDRAERGTSGYQPGSWSWISNEDLAVLHQEIDEYNVLNPNHPRPYPVEFETTTDSVMIGTGDAPGHDLLNDPLGLIFVGPAEAGQEGRAVGMINELLNRFRSDLVGVECDADYDFSFFDVNGIPQYFVKHNSIAFTDQWPKQLNRLFR